MSAKAIAAARLERQAAKRKNCCARCGLPFGPGEKYTIVAEQHLHLKCYACPFCGASLSGGGGMATPGVGVGYCCQKCHIERYAERCAACNKPLQPGSRVAVHKGRRMHPACFACAVCAKPIDGTFHDHDNGPTCERCYTRNFAPRCAACHVPFKPAEEYVKVKGKALHPSCFGCAVCATPLNIKGFYEKNGAAYCTQHYADKFGSKCALCATPMLSWTQNFHGDKYCSGHDAEMPKCFGCGRLVPDEPAGSSTPPAGVPPSGRSPRRALSLQRRSSGADYSDGRSVCKLCVPTAVHDLEAARALFAAVGTFFAGLGAPLPSVERVPLALLDRNSLAGLASFDVALHFPFAVSDAAQWHRWSGLDLHMEQRILTFPLDGLPQRVNQDVRVVISLPDGRRLEKFRRFQRAAPLPRDSTALAVQVAQLPRPIRELLQGRDRSGLQGQRLVEIHHPFDPGQSLDQGRGTHGESQTKPCQAPAFGEGEKLNPPLTPALAVQ